MAIEKNPNDQIQKQDVDETNIIPVDFTAMNSEQVNFEIDPDTGEIEVEFSFENSMNELPEDSENEFYENLARS